MGTRRVDVHVAGGGAPVSAIFTLGASWYRRMRAEYQDVHEAQYAAAVAATHGHMVNRRGLDRGWTSERVFTATPVAVRAYATRELLDHLAGHPRTTLAAYEAAWLETLMEAS